MAQHDSRPVPLPYLCHDDTLAPDDAWHVWEKLVCDERTDFLPMELAGLDGTWRQPITVRTASPKLWMDAHLAAWAKTADLAFVTFDAGFKSYSLPDLQLFKAV
jgi:uncharacterized protein